jgi:aminoglycoside 6'-N-acetyltransferase
VTELRGERVVLRPVVVEDAEALRAIRSEPEVARYWGPPQEGWPLEEPGTELPDVVMLAIESGGELIGFAEYFEEPDPDARSADMDIFITTRLHARGLGTEAFSVLAEHLLDDRGHHRLTLGADPGNARAIRMYERLGFRRVGILEAAARDPVTGEWRDELLMERVERDRL